MKIKVASLGNKVRIFTLLKGTTLGNFLKKWRYPIKNIAISINGFKIFDFGTTLKNNDIVVIVCPIKGGVDIRMDGNKWRIHKYDPDLLLPSPHAHNFEKGLKMDLSSGDLYDERSKRFLKPIRKKVLLDFRERAKKLGVNLPALII